MLAPEANFNPEGGVTVTHEDGTPVTLTMAEARAVASLFNPAGGAKDASHAAAAHLAEHGRLSAGTPAPGTE